MSGWLCLVFFLSGASALLFETLWFRQASLALGNSVWASSLVLAGFMGGLALGNTLAARFGHRITQPIRLYGLLEILIGATGFCLVLLLPALTPWTAPLLGPFLEEPWILNPLRLAIASGLLLFPTTAMGATLPLLVAALYANDARFGRVLGRLYGWNTIGAVVGAVCGDLILIAVFGIRGAAGWAVGLNLIAASIAFVLASRIKTPKNPSPVIARFSSLRWESVWLLASAFVLGSLLLALEVVWFRFLLLFVAGSSLAFSLMLAVVLAGIGLGGLAGGRWLARSPGAWRTAPTLAALAGALCIALYLGFDQVLDFSQQTSAMTASEIILRAIPLMFPVSLISGVLFTLLGSLLHEQTGGETWAAGLLTLANTTGGVAGSILGGFVLLPTLGMEASLHWLAGAYAIAAAFAFAGGARAKGGGQISLLATCVAALVLLFAFFPRGFLEENYLGRSVSRYVPPEVPVAMNEGLTETIIYLRRDAFGEPLFHRLFTNSHSMANTNLASHRYMKLFVYLPVALHPDPKKALLISFGVGGTARALADTHAIEQVDIVDISQDVLTMSRTLGTDTHEVGGDPGQLSPLDDPRVNVHIEDGRFFLETTDDRFDIITGEPPPPKLAGVVNLYTREYFELIYAKLADGGITTYWLPVHGLLANETKAILRAFCEVFEDCTLWTGAGLDWLMMGTRGFEGPVPLKHFEKQWRDPIVSRELVALGFEKPDQIGALFLADSDQISRLTADTPPLTDNYPKRLSDRIASSRYENWMNVDTTRKRFANSRILDDLWPSSLRPTSPKYFALQSAINAKFAVAESPNAPPINNTIDLVLVDQILEQTDLETLPLWRLDSTVAVQNAAKSASAKGKTGAWLEFELGKGALAKRNWPSAMHHFDRATAAGGAPDLAPLRIYALCRDGKFKFGNQLLDQLGQQANFQDDSELLGMLKRVCSPPRRPVRSSKGREQNLRKPNGR